MNEPSPTKKYGQMSRVYELLKMSLPELLEKFRGSEDSSMVYVLRGDGSVVLTKGGDLLWQRTLHYSSCAISGAPNRWTLAEDGEIVGEIEPPMSVKAQEESHRGNYWIVDSEEGCHVIRLKMLQQLVEHEYDLVALC